MLEERAGRPSRRVDERLRRLRRTEAIREMLKESRVHASNLMAPVFVKDGVHIVEPVETMPGVNRYSVDTVAEYVGRLTEEGVRSVLLFGLPGAKDESGSEAYSSDGV